jgi:hypothetical protein
LKAVLEAAGRVLALTPDHAAALEVATKTYLVLKCWNPASISRDAESKLLKRVETRAQALAEAIFDLPTGLSPAGVMLIGVAGLEECETTGFRVMALAGATARVRRDLPLRPGNPGERALNAYLLALKAIYEAATGKRATYSGPFFALAGNCLRAVGDVIQSGEALQQRIKDLLKGTRAKTGVRAAARST